MKSVLDWTLRRSIQQNLEEELLHACSTGDVDLVIACLDAGANMNTICSTGRTAFGTAAQLGNVTILKIFLDHCSDKKVSPSMVKKGESNEKKCEEPDVGDSVYYKNGSGSSESKNLDQNLNSCYDKMVCNCGEMDDMCLRKSCEHYKSIMTAINKTKYDLACFNDVFVRRDPRFKSKSCDCDLLSDDEVRTPDGMDGLEWDMEVEGNNDLEGDDPCSALYIWYAGILSQTSSLLEEKPPSTDIDREDQFGCRALHYAALGGHINAVRLLINAGCKVNVPDLDNSSPLHMAASVDEPEIVNLLIEAGAHVNRKTTDKISPLHVSASRGLLRNVKLLVKAGAHIDTLEYSDRSPLFMAVSRGHKEVVSYLLSQGAKINIEEIHGYTPLYEAVCQQNLDIVKMLLRAGAKITHSHHLLHNAILHRHEEMVRLLISAGCIINLRDESGDTPLILAAKTLQTDIVRLLLEKGAAVNCKNYITGNTALHETIKNLRGRRECFEEMLSIFQKFNVNLEGESRAGYRALYLAIFHKEDYAAAVLIRHGVNVVQNPRDEYSQALTHLFHLILQKGNRVLLELFVFAGYNFRTTQIPQNANQPLERWLLHLQSNPMRLCDLCRIKVRYQFKSKVYEKVSSLAIPSAIKGYLKLEDIS